MLKATGSVENPQVGATNEPRSITTRRGRPVRLPAYLQGYVTNLIRIRPLEASALKWTEEPTDLEI